jgi:cold shock CspA family protein
MQTGNIVQLFHDKEYGMIRTISGEEVHFHKNCLGSIRFDELIEGQEVEFFTQLTYKGLLGFEIRPT